MTKGGGGGGGGDWKRSHRDLHECEGLLRDSWPRLPMSASPCSQLQDPVKRHGTQASVHKTVIFLLYLFLYVSR